MATGTVATVEWFDGESGAPILRVPVEAVAECSHPGPCDSDVARWLPRVEWLADADTIRRTLKRYGAWDADELADDDANRARILWIACGDIRENPGFYV